MSRSNRYLTGYHAIGEKLISDPSGCVLFVTHDTGRVGELVRAARSGGARVEFVTRRALQDRAGPDARDCALEFGAGQSGAYVSLADLIPPEDNKTSVIVVLDHITDPHNLGAILRSADQFGVDGVVLPDRRSADITPVVLQSSAGAASHVRLSRVKNLAGALETLKEAGYWVYGADMDGGRADRTTLTGRVAIILGAEGKGLSRLLRERSDALVALPGFGHVDSFNVSVAAGILLYEIRRQQNWFDQQQP